jgi:hypothetical protein
MLLVVVVVIVVIVVFARGLCGENAEKMVEKEQGRDAIDRSIR